MRIEIDCERIYRNAKAIVEACAEHGVRVAGVTKACCGHPAVAEAMLQAGVALLAESRLSNVRRLRDAGIDAEVLLLRLPSSAEAEQVVNLTGTSLNSELETVEALSQAASVLGRRHKVILMLETGDRREGVLLEDALDTARAIMDLPGIELTGIGSNVTCIGGVLPTQANTQQIVDVAEQIERALGVDFEVISGGPTATLALLYRDELPARINQLRIGGGILLGEDSAGRGPLPVPHQDAFEVLARVIEVKTKPSMPEGPITIDAFGRTPQWTDLGLRRRAILAIGEQDLRIDGLTPKRPGITVVGASSDHLVVDVTEAETPVNLGDELAFGPSYGAVATAMASRDVVQVVRLGYPHEC